MATVTYRGTFEPKRQAMIERWSPTSGSSTEWVWKSFSEARIREYFYTYATAGCECEYTNDLGVHTLIARVPNLSGAGSSEVTIDKWEVGLNKLSLAISRHPIVVAILIRSNDAANVRAGMKEFLESTQLYEDIANFSFVDSADDSTLKAILNQAREGVDSFYLSSYTLRHTTNVSNRWDVNVSDIDVDTIYTTAQLLSETQNANSWNYPLPGRLAYKLLQIESDFISRYGILADSGYEWGWLKFGSPETTVANGRVDIVTEYEFGLISTLLYS